MSPPSPTEPQTDRVARTAAFVAMVLALAPRGEKVERLVAAGTYYGVFLLVRRAVRPDRLRLPSFNFPMLQPPRHTGKPAGARTGAY